MIRKYIVILFLLAGAMVLPTGCTHNNGDIGPWFGQWKLTEMTVDGETDGSYEGNIFWGFQTHIFQMNKVIPGIVEVADQRWGSWAESGDELILNFTYTSGSTPPDIGAYSPLPETFFPANSICRLKILKRPGDSMELEYITPEGRQITYYLIKW